MPCTNPPDAVGVVLAGGRSSRMGRDKADIEWRPGQTLLARAVERAGAAGCESVIVSGDRPGYDHVPDLEPGTGPLGGLDSVLRERAPGLERKLLLIVPLDMPILTASTLRRLLDAAAESERGAVFANGPLPMAVRCDRKLGAAVRKVVQGGGKRSLGELARLLELDVLANVQDREMANVNRRDELAALRGRCAQASND